MEVRFNNMQSMLEKLIAGLSTNTDQNKLDSVAQSLFSCGVLKTSTTQTSDISK
jgi:hypothetical protein